MAGPLLDAALRTRGQPVGKQLWPAIQELQLKIALPDRVAVINTFTKIVRPKKNGPSDDDGTGLVTPLGSSIAYREYVSFGGTVSIAAQTAAGDHLPDALAELFAHITYLGKRGSFMQLLVHPTVIDDADLDAETAWVTITHDQASFVIGGTLQMLDDCGPTMTFNHADIYSKKRITLGKERILRHIVLPYQLVRSSRGFSLYERIRP